MLRLVHVRQGFDSEWIETLRRQLHPAIRLTHGKDSPVPGDCEVLVCGRPSSEDLAASTSLKAVIVPWAGVPKQTRELLRDFPHVTLHNLHHNAAPGGDEACCSAG